MHTYTLVYALTSFERRRLIHDFSCLCAYVNSTVHSRKAFPWVVHSSHHASCEVWAFIRLHLHGNEMELMKCMMEPLQTTGPLRCSGIAFASERTQFVLVRSHACAQVPHSSSSLWINIKEHIRANRTRSLSTVFIHSLTQRTWLKFTWNQTCVKSKLLICLPEEHPSLHYVSHSLSLSSVCSCIFEAFHSLLQSDDAFSFFSFRNALVYVFFYSCVSCSLKYICVYERRAKRILGSLFHAAHLTEIGARRGEFLNFLRIILKHKKIKWMRFCM